MQIVKSIFVISVMVSLISFNVEAGLFNKKSVDERRKEAQTMRDETLLRLYGEYSRSSKSSARMYY